MIRDLGIVQPGTLLYIPFHTFDSNDPSASVTLTGLATTDIEVYKDGSVTQRASDAGYALLDTDGIDFDAVTGIHGISIDLADNTTAGFYAAGSQYWVVVASVTVDAATVNFVLCTFRIGYQAARLNTTIATLASQTSFTLTVGPAEDDALNGCWCVIHDVASAVQCGHAIISDYTGSTKTVTLAAGTTFTAAATDNVAIMGPMPMQPTVSGRTLDVTATGAAGVDWANVEGQGTTVGLTATTVATVTTATTATTATNLTNLPSIPANWLTAAGIAAAALNGKGDWNIGKTGYSLTATTGLGNQTADITGSLSGSVGSVTGAVGSVTGAVGSVTTVSSSAISEASFATTAGSFAPLGIVDQGTAQSATGTTLVLRAAAALADDTAVGMILMVLGSTQGYWQAREITDYVSATDTATVDAWTVTPSGTITYKVFAGVPAPATPPSVNVTQISGDATAADNAEAFFDGTGYAGTGNVIPTVTAVTTVNGLAANTITATAIAADAITAAKIATGAIDADALAADAVTEIWAKALTELAAVPAVTGTVIDALNWLFTVARNKIEQTATTSTLRKDDGTTALATSTVSDDATTFTRGEWA